MLFTCCNAPTFVLLTPRWSPESNTTASTFRKIQFSQATDNTCCRYFGVSFTSLMQCALWILQKEEKLCKIITEFCGITKYYRHLSCNLVQLCFCCMIYTYFEKRYYMTGWFSMSSSPLSTGRVIQYARAVCWRSW